MKKNALLMVSGFLLAVIVIMGFGIIHVPHKILVKTYLYSRIPNAKRVALNQMIRQADTIWELNTISAYSFRIGRDYVFANFPKQQRIIAKKMLKMAVQNPDPEEWERTFIKEEDKDGMEIALRWCHQILWNQSPKNHKKIQRMVKKSLKTYRNNWERTTTNTNLTFWINEINNSKPHTPL